MKKIFLSLLAIAALASCVKTEDFYTEENSEIKIKPATSIATKANHLTAIDGTEYPVAEDFDVYGYWKDMPAGSKFIEGETLYLGLGNKAVEFTNKGNYWGGAENTYYWPKNGSLRFAAYSPSSLDMAHTLANDTYTADVEYTANTNETYDILVAPTSPSYTAMTAAENVSVVFEHALAWITVKVVAKDEDAAKAFDIKKVTIDNVITEASLTAEMSKNAKTEDKMTWDLTGTPAAVEVYNGSQAVTSEPTIIETVANGTLVIPQATTTLTINYTQNALPGTPALENQKKTVDLVLDKENTPWKPGKHYVYTLVFGLDEILINPDVVDWDDVIVNDIEVGTTNVYSVEQLQAALEKGGKIVLQESLEATSLSVKADAVLDLNGKTITGADNLTTGSYGLLNVNAGVSLTIDGPGTLTATASNDRDWNAYSSVISNQTGTLIVNEGVVIEHFGGTDMAYGIDNLTNTGAQPAVTIVNGATVKSTYRAIRQFLNSTKANNELYVNKGSKIEGTNKSIWSQNANSKANPGKTVVEAGAELKGDVMLSASSAAEWPVEVSIAASALVDGAKVVPSNVPAGYAVVLVDGVYTVVKGATGVATAEEFAAAVKQTAKDIEIILNADIEVAISTLGQQTGGSGEYKLGGEETENFTIDLNGHKLTITTTYWSNLGAKNDNALFTIKNGTMDSSQPTGTWNSYDLTFSNCDYVIENVVFEKAIAFDNAKKAVTLKNVTINEDHDYYAMWITAAGQNVTIDGLTINSDGRGIKIDEQYVNESLAHVTLKVSNATFETKNKAAILVKSAAGAHITLDNVDITKVAKDDFFHVWVDEDAEAYADKVVVDGGLCMVEGKPVVEVETADALKDLAEMVNAGENFFAGVTIKLAADIDLNDVEWTPIGSATADHGFMGNFDGNGYVIKNLNITNVTPDSDGYSYAGFFGVTEGTPDAENYIKNLVIENVNIETTGHIAAAAIAYPYYTTLENITVKGDINIKGGDYTSGVLAYTRRCVNAANIEIAGNEGSSIAGRNTVGGVISDIQMNGGLKANYSNFKASGLTISGNQCVGGISGIICLQTLDGATVENVVISCSDHRVGIVSGAQGGEGYVENASYSNVSGATEIIGGNY